MATNRHEPADTRSMGIVHSALRRDLERTRMVLTDQPYPDPTQRRALASHLTWMMHFLHLHHTGEDVGLWPLIRARNPSAGALLDQMDADHRRIGPAITALEEAARAYRERRLGPRTDCSAHWSALSRRAAAAPAAGGAGDDAGGRGHPHGRAVPGGRARALRGTQGSARARRRGALGPRRAPARWPRGHAGRGPRTSSVRPAARLRPGLPPRRSPSLGHRCGGASAVAARCRW